MQLKHLPEDSDNIQICTETCSTERHKPLKSNNNPADSPLISPQLLERENNLQS